MKSRCLLLEEGQAKRFAPGPVNLLGQVSQTVRAFDDWKRASAIAVRCNVRGGADSPLNEAAQVAQMAPLLTAASVASSS